LSDTSLHEQGLPGSDSKNKSSHVVPHCALNNTIGHFARRSIEYNSEKFYGKGY